MWGRSNTGKTVEEITDFLRLVDHVRALQEGQKEIAEAIMAVNHRLTAIESDMKTLKAETQRDALREVQQAVHTVQSVFHEKLGQMSSRLAVLEQAIRRATMRPQSSASPTPPAPPHSDGSR
ncbi:hypothetical protein ACQR1I_24475 [Bradyrhizobium sp. HKCCYLS2038]|uniref:hypothetical protein n=1 Tax=unclassified Bradyrhizobium TaxID=2631580 RepID=UPI003EBD6561